MYFIFLVFSYFADYPALDCDSQVVPWAGHSGVSIGGATSAAQMPSGAHEGRKKKKKSFPELPHAEAENGHVFFLFLNTLLSRDNDLSHYLDITKIVFSW